MESDRDSTIWLEPLVLESGFGVEFREDHVRVRIDSGLKVSSEQRDLLWGKIARICERHGTRRVLVEGKVPEGVFQTSEVIDAGLKTATVPKLWLAFCFEDFQPNELTELYETVAGSKGIRVKHFAVTEHALRWLRNNTPA